MFIKICFNRDISRSLLGFIRGNSAYLRFDYNREGDDFPFEYFSEYDDYDDVGDEKEIKLSESEYELDQKEFEDSVILLLGILDASPADYEIRSRIDIRFFDEQDEKYQEGRRTFSKYEGDCCFFAPKSGGMV